MSDSAEYGCTKMNFEIFETYEEAIFLGQREVILLAFAGTFVLLLLFLMYEIIMEKHWIGIIQHRK